MLPAGMIKPDVIHLPSSMACNLRRTTCTQPDLCPCLSCTLTRRWHKGYGVESASVQLHTPSSSSADYDMCVWAGGGVKFHGPHLEPRAYVLPRPICRNVLEDVCCIKFGGFFRGFSWRIFLGTFSHKNEEEKSGEKIRKKIRRPKNKNPRKIRSAESRP